MFHIDLTVNPNSGDFAFNVPPAQFGERINVMFEKVITSLQNIPQVERNIMKNLFWSQSPVLSSVHKMEVKVVSIQQRIVSAIRIFRLGWF